MKDTMRDHGRETRTPEEIAEKRQPGEHHECIECGIGPCDCGESPCSGCYLCGLAGYIDARTQVLRGEDAR
jgi:hypothetical protein